MTLQYRTRDTTDDRRWERRVRLLKILMLDSVNAWCLHDNDFPCEFALASVLHIFSSKCNPMEAPDAALVLHLEKVVLAPEEEVSRSQPEVPRKRNQELVISLRSLIELQILGWEDGETVSPETIGELESKIIDEIVRLKYVRFHRTQTTSRDGGGFHGLW